MEPVTRRYIEFRVYLEDDATDVEEIKFAADDLQDEISDMISDDDAPNIFVGDVTYELKLGGN